MKKLILLVSSLLLIACGTTGNLWKNPTYKEKMGSFLITEDGEKFAIIGSKYHYIFHLDNKLKNILMSKNRSLLRPSFYSFKVDDENNISGKFKIYYSSKNENDGVWFKENGFKESTYRKSKVIRYIYSGSVSGKRYSTNEEINQSFDFNKSYIVQIEEPASVISHIGKILATPVTVAVDGATAIGGVAVFTLLATVVIIKGSEK